jgi:two-component system, sensor histidine kinase LadS
MDTRRNPTSPIRPRSFLNFFTHWQNIVLLFVALSTLSCTKESYNDHSTYYLLEDSTRSINATQAWKAFQQNRFQQQRGNSFNPGFTRSYYWLVVKTDSVTSNQQFLEIGTSQINELQFYPIVNGEPGPPIVTGDYYNFSNRPLPVLNFVFPLHNTSDHYLLRVDKTFESLQLTYRTIDGTRFQIESTESSMIMGVMTGGIFLMIVFGLFLFAITREKVYLFYCLYVASGWFYVMANQGYGFKYFWPDFPWFAGRARPVFVLLTVIFSLHFVSYYAGEVKKRWLRNIIKTLFITCYTLLLLFNLPFLETKDNPLGYVLQGILPILAGVYVVVILITLTDKLVNKNRMALFYLLSLFPIILFSVLQIIYYSGGVDFSGSYLQTFGQATGYVLEAIILTFGLAYRFNTYRLEKEQALINLNVQQSKYARAIIMTQENERRQIADQLHDIAGSLLSAARLNLSSVREKTLIPNAEAQKKLETAENAVSDISEMLRNMSHAISPVMLDKVGFKQAVEKVAGIFNTSGKIKVEIETIGFENENPTMYEKYSVLYGILYELLNNIVKHAKASHGLIQLIEHDDSVVLVVEDNGVGLNTQTLNESATHGLAAIQSKIHYLQGTMVMDKAEPNGLIITIEIPKSANDKSNLGG